MTEKRETGVVTYTTPEGEEVKLSPSIVKKLLVSGGGTPPIRRCLTSLLLR